MDRFAYSWCVPFGIICWIYILQACKSTNLVCVIIWHQIRVLRSKYIFISNIHGPLSERVDYNSHTSLLFPIDIDFETVHIWSYQSLCSIFGQVRVSHHSTLPFLLKCYGFDVKCNPHSSGSGWGAADVFQAASRIEFTHRDHQTTGPTGITSELTSDYLINGHVIWNFIFVLHLHMRCDRPLRSQRSVFQF